MAEQQSLQSLVESETSIVDRLFKNPPKSALNIFGVMMPPEVVRPEFTTWRDEQQSWRKGIALHDQSYHMNNLRVTGPGALALFTYLGINSFATFKPGAAKQFIAVSPEGYVIGDAILYYIAENELLLVGNPATTDWVQFNGEKGDFDVKVSLDPIWVLNPEKRRDVYRFQVEGPNAYDLLEELHGGSLPEIKFFRSGAISIAGHEVVAMRHSMGGVPGLELSGPWDDRVKVKKALVEAGTKHGLRQIGSLAYFSTVIESGWWAVPFSAVYTSPGLREYREWLSTKSSSARMSLGGSFYSSDPEDYYLTPWDLNYGHIVKFDHEFVGREALERLVDQPHRKKVTLLWHPEDFTNIFQRLVNDGPTAMHVDLPVSATARVHYDKILDADGNHVGFGTYPGYSYNERAQMSLGSVDAAWAEPGTQLTLVWGEDGGGKRSEPWIEPHEQVHVRVTVAPSPISDVAREYRVVQTGVGASA
ncbi:MAG TPA: aminomethyl transferase family protein [Microbacterium sp.]|uniref:aminomethyl transferase family protein n=1 Tax=Microbacterium sp. TaxID=51671 RepID=UPI002CD60504|nr:aminomethyl transferase family protein [Microbacterium sp.]HWI32427.1 aminomethyl transferase family protein [Microbacterium sp.]